MRIPRIYTPQRLACGQQIELESQASHHLQKVLRMQAGDSLLLFNGDGNDYPAQIVELKKKHLLINVEQPVAVATESPLAIHLGIGISKGDRMDLVMQKATELGASAITPLFTERTEVRLKGERLEKKQAHWQQVIISACEQSGRTRLPQLYNASDIQHWLTSVEADRKYVLHHRSKEDLSGSATTNSVALAVGPEGGLSDREITLAEMQMFKPLALGPRVLRTETAPLAALSVLQFLWGDIGQTRD